MSTTISRLIIDQQFASIGIKVTPAQLQISTPKRQMKVEANPAEMNVETQKAEMEINWSRVNYQQNRKTSAEFNRDFAEKGKIAGYEYTAASSRDGEFLGMVERPGNRVAELAKRKNREENSPKDLNITPSEMPEVKWDKGYVNIDWSDHSFKIEWDENYMPEVVIEPKYSVEIFLRNQPRITITVEETALTDGVGMLVDMRM